MLLSIITVIVVILTDQLTKYLAVSNLKPIGTYPLIQDVLHLTYVENTGAAFGMLKNQRWIFMVFSVVLIVFMVVFIYKYGKKLSFWLNLGISFALGGGLGNMIDRVLNGYVVDFIDVRLINFAVFNVADSFVCVGVALIVIDLLFGKGKTFWDEKSPKTQNENNDSES